MKMVFAALLTSLACNVVHADPYGGMLLNGSDSIIGTFKNDDKNIRIKDTGRAIEVQGKSYSEVSLRFQGYVLVDGCQGDVEIVMAERQVPIGLPVTEVKVAADADGRTTASARFFADSNGQVFVTAQGRVAPIGTIAKDFSGQYLNNGATHYFKLEGGMFRGSCDKDLTPQDFSNSLPVSIDVKGF